VNVADDVPASSRIDIDVPHFDLLLAAVPELRERLKCALKVVSRRVTVPN